MPPRRTIWNNEYETLARGECMSMRALVWPAGRPRYMADGASVGFHAPWRDADDKVEVSSIGSALVGGYLQDIGIARAAIAYMTEPGPDQMQILSPHDARHYGIEFEHWRR